MMCIISKQRIAFCAQVEGTWGEIFTASPIALQSRITSKGRIAFSEQVEGTRGEICAAWPIALQSRCKHVPNGAIRTDGHSWPQHESDRSKYKTDEWEERVKQRSEGNRERDALNWRRARSVPPPGCLWQLGQTVSTRTESLHPDGNIFCECKIPLLGQAHCLTTTSSWMVSVVVIDCPQPITFYRREKLASTPMRCGMMVHMSHAAMERSAWLECVYSCWHHQSVMSGIQNVLLSSLGSWW